MNINKKIDNEKIVLNLEGRLDTTTSPILQHILLPAFDDANHIELDFSLLDYVSSAGLRIILLGQKAAQNKNKVFTITNVSDDIMEVFEMTGFADMLTIVK